MPWSPAQHRLFEAAAHNPEIAARKGIPQAQAAKMAGEGVKDKPKKLARALRGHNAGAAGGAAIGSAS